MANSHSFAVTGPSTGVIGGVIVHAASPASRSCPRPHILPDAPLSISVYRRRLRAQLATDDAFPFARYWTQPEHVSCTLRPYSLNDASVSFLTFATRSLQDTI